MRNLIVFLCFFFSGCVWTQDYPADWPAEVATTESCPNIEGNFADTGRTSDRPWLFMDEAFVPTASLSYELVYVEYVGLEQVAITQPDADTIIVTAIDAERASNSHDFDRNAGEFWCDKGKIWFPSPWGRFRVDKTGFSKAIDGSLVAEDHTLDVNGKSVMFYLWSAYTTDDSSTN